MATTPERWGEQYRERRRLFEDFEAEVVRLIDLLLAEDGIDLAQRTSRTKSVASFVGKIQRKGGKYADPLAEITDLAAVRLIAFFPADVERIGQLIRDHFRVDADNSRRPGDGTDPDRFGYRSEHYVVWLSGDRASLPENQRFADLRAEIQVRTVMQHAWAAVDHQLRYKNAAELPEELQRRLYRLSALLEVADEQFAALDQARNELEETYVGEVTRGDLSAEIHVLSLQAFLETTGVGNRWAVRATQVGFALPFQGDSAEGLDRLSHVLRVRGIGTLQSLERLLDDAEGWGAGHLAALARATQTVFAVPADVLTFLALRDAPREIIDQLGFRPDIATALHQLNRSSGR